MTQADNDTTYEPIEQRKANAIREKRVIQLYTHVFQSLCAIVSANMRWHNEEISDSDYKDEMVNQARSIVYNAIELTIGKRPSKLG